VLKLSTDVFLWSITLLYCSIAFTRCQNVHLQESYVSTAHDGGTAGAAQHRSPLVGGRGRVGTAQGRTAQIYPQSLPLKATVPPGSDLSSKSSPARSQCPQAQRSSQILPLQGQSAPGLRFFFKVFPFKARLPPGSYEPQSGPLSSG